MGAEVLEAAAAAAALEGERKRWASLRPLEALPKASSRASGHEDRDDNVKMEAIHHFLLFQSSPQYLMKFEHFRKKKMVSQAISLVTFCGLRALEVISNSARVCVCVRERAEREREREREQRAEREQREREAAAEIC